MSGLRQQAFDDLNSIFSDESSAVWPVTITDPDGVTKSFDARVKDVHQQIDPGTGEVITGRQVSVVVSLLSLLDAGFLGIRGIPDALLKPWVVEFEDIIGRSGRYKIVETFPDNILGLMVCHCEVLV